MMKMIDRIARSVFVAALTRLSGGRLTLHYDGERLSAGAVERNGPGAREPIDASLTVHHEQFYRRAIVGGDIGLGESYMDGDWSGADLVPLIRLALRNLQIVDGLRGVVPTWHSPLALIARRLRDNTITGSRAHVRQHYDLGNDFFRLFLDDHLMYSCAFYETGSETLEQAQQNKLDQICTKLDLRPSDHVLEIGTGWGGFAAWAATHYGCRVTTTTISDEQYRYARDWCGRLGDAGSRVELLKRDYRELTGRYDKIVSIEMFEAVGLSHYDEYFAAVNRLLAPNGSMLLQTITMDDQHFPSYRRSADWIEKHIFPGGELASVGEVLKSLGRASSMSMYHAENLGIHYARTLHAWRERFLRQLDRVRAMGFDDRFIRMWDFYLASCEAAFLERHIGVFQLLLTKNYSTSVLFNEPWNRQAAGDASAVA